jgi:hypothetical protein
MRRTSILAFIGALLLSQAATAVSTTYIMVNRTFEYQDWRIFCVGIQLRFGSCKATKRISKVEIEIASGSYAATITVKGGCKRALQSVSRTIEWSLEEGPAYASKLDVADAAFSLVSKRLAECGNRSMPPNGKGEFQDVTILLAALLE